jgi:hypothetical protein
MRSVFWLLVLLLVPSQAIAHMMFPSPPQPVPLQVPNCAMQLMGIANNVHYWVTGACPLTPNGPTGFGQTMKLVPTGCCMDPMDPDPMNAKKCCSTVALVSTLGAGALVAKVGGFELTACSLPESTPQELDNKLREIIKECKRIDKYLKKLTKIGNSEISGDRRILIAVWQNYIASLISYLEDPDPSADPVVTRVYNYCNTVVEAFRKHEANWSTPTLKPGNGKPASVRDESLTSLLAADAVIFVPEPGVTHFSSSDKVWEIKVNDLPGNTSKTVYFKTFTYWKTDEGPLKAAQFGMQVSGPGTSNPQKAKFKDRNTYGHKIASNDESQLFLVSSFDDLSVAP